MKLITELTNKLKYSEPAIDFIEIETSDVMATSNYYYKHEEKEKQHKKSKLKNMPENYKSLSKEEIREILNKEVENLFPKTGSWSNSCYQGEGLQCKLRDNNYLSDWFKQKLESNGIFISKQEVLSYILNSGTFARCRHDYELEIVKWQINWMKNGGDGWLMPKGYGEFDMLRNPDVDKIFRQGVVKTLRAINLNKDVIEEGLEKFADSWRETYMSIAFDHAYGVPISFLRKTKLEPPAPEHKENWLKLRRYDYYVEHLYSVHHYGSKHPDMFMSDEEVEELRAIVNAQNEERTKVINLWMGMKNDTKHYYEV